MANQVTVGALFQEGTSQVRPSYFNGEHFSHWKIRMEIFTKAYDVKVWRVIKKGNYTLSVSTPLLTDPDNINSYSKEQLETVQINHKARNMLHNAISDDEKISSYYNAKEMWDKLEVTYEGASKVKETRINMFLHDYELFSMKEGEYIEEIFARFSKIISDLKAFGKPYTSGDQNTFEKTNQEEKKKTVAFKATTKAVENEIDDPESLQEEIDVMSINMDGLMRRYRNTKKGKFPPRRSRQYYDQDKNDGKCYECENFVHIQAKCPELKKKISRGFNKNRSFGSWSDEDDSDHEEISNLCFMMILENEINRTPGCWTDEDDSDDENCFMSKGETSEEHHRVKRKGKLYLNSACYSRMIGDKTCLKKSQKLMEEVSNLEMTQSKIVGTGTAPFNNSCDITEVYLVDGLNYNLLSISQLCDSGYEIIIQEHWMCHRRRIR